MAKYPDNGRGYVNIDNGFNKSTSDIQTGAMKEITKSVESLRTSTQQLSDKVRENMSKSNSNDVELLKALNDEVKILSGQEDDLKAFMKSAHDWMDYDKEQDLKSEIKRITRELNLSRGMVQAEVRKASAAIAQSEKEAIEAEQRSKTMRLGNAIWIYGRSRTDRIRRRSCRL